MTVKELVEQLKDLDQDREVLLGVEECLHSAKSLTYIPAGMLLRRSSGPAGGEGVYVLSDEAVD